MQIALKDRINRIYVISTDTEELLKAYNELNSLYLNNPTVKNYMKLNPDLKTEYGVHESLSMRLYAKYLLLKYFSGYSQEDKQAAIDYIKGAISISADSGYMKTTKLLANVRDFIDDVHEIMADAVSAVNRVRDSSGELATDNLPLIREAYATMRKTLEKAKTLEDALLFPEGVRIPDLQKRMIKDLEEECQWFSSALSSNSDATSLRILEECSAPLESSGFKTSASYYESPLDRTKITARVVILSSPFADEAALFAGVYSSLISKPFSVLYADKLEGYSAEGLSMENLFETAEGKSMNLLILGIEKLSPELAEQAKIAILKASHGNSHFLIHDKIGSRALYESFDRTAADTDGLSSLDVYHVFLTMPSFNSVCKLLTEHGYISDTEADKEKVRAAMPFSGFVGLNTVLSSDPGSDWLRGASLRSEENFDVAIIYLNKLIASRQLIDDGWGKFSGHIRYVKGEKKEFDYDDLHGLDKENIRKIMEKTGISTFDRCGLIVKYCLLSGNDVTAWKSFSGEERTKRATMATTLVARVLDTSYAPKVEIIPEEKWERSSAGGICVDGGKRIIYRESSTDNYSWMEDAICHECFHAFQHTALTVPYADWFFAELGVTEGRIASWDDNFKVYVGSEEPKTYRVEVVECDARAFALDCLRNIENYWKDIDFN